MPTYEYACKSCGERTEAVQAFSDPPLTECPRCGGSLRKVFGTPAIVLKGSGFYKTDSRAAAGSNGSGKKGAEAQSGSTGESSSKDASSGNGSSDKAGSDATKGGSDTSGSKKDAAPASSTAAG